MLENSEQDIFQLLESQTNICRFCFIKLDEAKYTFSVFERDLFSTLKFCCSDFLLEDVTIPKHICLECHSSLQSTYKFLKKIASSHNILKNYVVHLDSKTDIVSKDKDTRSVSDCDEAEPEDDLFEIPTSTKSSSKKTVKKGNIIKTNSTGRKVKMKKLLLNKCCDLSQHIVQRNYPCSSCNKRYRSYFELEVHLRTHTGEKPFTCSTCGKSFFDNRNLRKHEKIHTGKKEHECTVCHRKFLHLFSLNTHEKIHKGEKRYICDACGKSFISSGELTIHLRTHTKERPYVCSVCKKAFSSKAALNTHSSVHTGIKNHACLVCDRKCRTAFDLKVHMRCHNSEKPYFCTYANCGKKYKNSSHLNVHLRTHKGEKPHQCAVCYKKFGELNTLTRHLVTHKKP